MNRIKEFRNAAGFQQGELAQQIGVSKGLLCRWENGYDSVPEAHQAVVAEALGHTVEEMDYQNFTPAPKSRAQEQRLKWGLALARVRVASGMNRVDLAKKLGVNATTVRAWESGYCSPAAESMQKLESLFPGIEHAEAQRESPKRAEKEPKLIVLPSTETVTPKPRRTRLDRVSWTAAQARARGMEYGEYVAVTTEKERDAGFREYRDSWKNPGESETTRYNRISKVARANPSAYVARMRQAMNAAGITSLDVLAATAGVSSRQMENYHAHGQVPNPENLKKICAALGVTDEWLLAG